MALSIDVAKGEVGTYKVKLTGSLDTGTCAQFDEMVQQVLADPESRALRLEMQDLTFISSLGIGVVIKAQKAMNAKGGVLAMVGAQPQIIKVFEIMRLLPKETVFASREEADEYFAMIQRKVVEGQMSA
jgi:anti-anti-sigma factor